MAIMKRYYIAVKCTLASPLAISSGIGDHTDADLMRNGESELFIPGSSLAGAFRAYLRDRSIQSRLMGDEVKRFNPKKNDINKMSSLFIEDVYFEKPKVSTRDSIKLNDDKQVEQGAKFDFEVIDTGAQATIYMEYVQRDDYDPLNDIAVLLQGLQSGEIRLGAKKTRGMGRLTINDVYKLAFDQEHVTEYLKYLDHPESLISDQNNWNDWKAANGRHDYITITVPLKQMGGISIRKYSAKSGDPDFVHITSNNMPVIPGTSWNGAFRAGMREILREVGFDYSSIEKILNLWFGYVKGDRAQKSLVVFGESVIEGGTSLISTRNNIDRFDASSVNLYTEKAHFNGRTTLEIMIEKDESREYEALCGFLDILLEELKEGYIALGGQTAIGRGLFEYDSSQEMTSYSTENSTKKLGNYLEALKHEVK